MRARNVLVATTSLALLLTGCTYNGINDLTLPGAQGTGEGSYQVDLVMANVGDLVPNNPVRLNDVNVGTITGIRLDGWNAVVTVSLEPDVELPSNVTARVGQSSLLGAKYIELARPAGGGVGTLAAGETVPIERTGKYTETEELLTSVAMLLNGGGLNNLRTITAELNRTFEGRAPEFRTLLAELNTFVTGLEEQKADIVSAIDGLDRLGAEFARHDPQIESALDNFPPALEVLEAERANLLQTLDALSVFGLAADDVVSRGGDDLAENIENLSPALQGLADAGESLTQSLDMIGTALFPLRSFGDVIQGDFINFYATIDLTLGSLDRGFLTGTSFEGKLGAVERALAAGLGVAGDVSDPLTAPVAPDGLPGLGQPILPELGTDPIPEEQRGETPQDNRERTDPAPTPEPAPGLLDGILGG